MNGNMTEKTIGNNRGIAESNQNILLLFVCEYFPNKMERGGNVRHIFIQRQSLVAWVIGFLL